MRGIVFSGVVAFCLLVHPAQGIEVQTGDVQIDNQIVEYPIHADFLRGIHFRNLSYSLRGNWVQLRNGKYEEKFQPFGGTWTKLEHIWFLDGGKGAEQHVLVWITQTECGASCGMAGFALVFGIKNGMLLQIQQIEFNAKETHAGIDFDPAHTRMIILAKSGKDASGCCASYLDELTFVWKDGKFEPTNYRLRPL